MLKEKVEKILGGLLRHPEHALDLSRKLFEDAFQNDKHLAIYRGILNSTADVDLISPESVSRAIETTSRGEITIEIAELERLRVDACEDLAGFKTEFEVFAQAVERFRATPARLHLAADLNHELEKPDHVLPGLLAGTVGGLVSPGAVGKSTFSKQLGAAIAAESAGANLLGLDIPTSGRVIIAGAEDPEVIILERMRRLFERIQDPDLIEEVLQRLTILPLLGQDVDIMNDHWQTIFMRKMEGARLLILDTLSDFHTLDENKTNEAGKVMSVMKRMAKKTDCAILYLHHVSKGAALNGMADLQQAARGSGVFVDKARWLAFVARMDKADCERLQVSIPEDQYKWWIRFGASKLNYAAPMDDIWLRREEGGVLVQHDPRTYQPGDRSIPLRVMRGRGND